MENLASKYRPRTWEDMSEQDLAVKILKKMCESESLETRNFLLIGPAGVGKTTSARIMAEIINEGSGDVIEIDAASHSGVDSARELVGQMTTYPVGSKYKVFIHDECFTGDTLVHTTSGLVPIKNIKPGTLVYNMTGKATVSHVFNNIIKTKNLICIRVNGKPIITTQSHLFFTDDGWVEAKDLKAGDILYDYKNMCSLREGIPSDVSERFKEILQQNMPIHTSRSAGKRSTLVEYTQNLSYLWERFLDSEVYQSSNLLRQMWRRVEEATSQLGEIEIRTCKALAVIYMSSLQQTDGDTDKRPSENLFSGVRSEVSESTNCEETDTICEQEMRKLWEYISSELRQSYEENMQRGVCYSTSSLEEFNKTSRNIQQNEGANEDSQPWVRSKDSREDEGNKTETWLVNSEACYALWERTFLQTADSFERRLGNGVGVRVLSEDSCGLQGQPESLSTELQTRPSLTKIDARDRGGWDRPQYEISTIIRRKEGFVSREFRVDSVESYQRGSNDELFQDHFPNTEIRNAEYVTMYDLEVEGHPSYFVEDILVHNCHAYSSAAWQSFLKVLEEQPARTVNIFCTTNPEKIPATIISRVQVFQLSKISLAGITSRLKHIIECENTEGRNIQYTDEAVTYIAKMANGGMRDAITLLDKALAYSEELNIENLSIALGLPSYDDYFELLRAITKKDDTNIVKIIHEVYNSGTNFVKWFEGFHSFVCQIIKYIYIQDINKTMIPSNYQQNIVNYNTKHAAICLILSKKLVDLNTKLKSTQYLQEMAITYLCEI